MLINRIRSKLELLWSKLLKDSHLQELVRGALGFLNLRVAGLALNYAFLILATRWYGAEVIGVYAISISALRLAMLYGRIGLDNALVRFIAEYKTRNRWDYIRQVYKRAIWISIPFSIAVSVILYAAAPFLADNVFDNTAFEKTLRIFSFAILPGTLLYVNAAVLRGLKRTSSYSFLVNVAQFLLALGIIVAGKSMLEEVTAPVTAFAIATVVSAIISFAFGIIPKQKTVPKEPDPETDEGPIGTFDLMKVAFPMLMTGSYSFFLSWTGVIVMGIYCSEAEVGVYNIAVRVSSLLAFTLMSVNSIAASKFAECNANNDAKGMEKVTRFSTRLIFWTTVPPGLILLLFPTFILGLFGKDITGGVTALAILVAGNFMNAIAGPVGTILNMTGHQLVYQNIILFSAILNIGLNILLIPQYGMNGSALAATISMVTWNIACIIYIKRKFGFLTMYIPFMNRRRGAG